MGLWQKLIDVWMLFGSFKGQYLLLVGIRSWNSDKGNRLDWGEKIKKPNQTRTKTTTKQCYCLLRTNQNISPEAWAQSCCHLVLCQGDFYQGWKHWDLSPWCPLSRSSRANQKFHPIWKKGFLFHDYIQQIHWPFGGSPVEITHHTRIGWNVGSFSLQTGNRRDALLLPTTGGLEDTEETEPYTWRCTTTWQEAMGTNWNMWNSDSIFIWAFLTVRVIKYWKKLSRWVVKPSCLQVFTTGQDTVLSSAAYFESEVGLDDLWRSLPTWITLWVYDSLIL